MNEDGNGYPVVEHVRSTRIEALFSHIFKMRIVHDLLHGSFQKLLHRFFIDAKPHWLSKILQRLYLHGE